VALALVFCAALAAFWSLYAVVPFLLALGLAVLSAVWLVAVWRLWRRPELRVQHATWKRNGRWTWRGWLAAAGGAALVALLVHSLVVQYHHRAGEALAYRDVAPATPPAARAAELARSADHLRTAARLGLLPDPRVEKSLGLVLRERGDYAGAEAHLRNALRLQPRWPAASLPLTDLLALRGAWREAEQILRELLAADPHLAPARQRLQLLEQRR
jgi:tetratricopeptide (TPR) repeat protein